MRTNKGNQHPGMTFVRRGWHLIACGCVALILVSGCGFLGGGGDDTDQQQPPAAVARKAKKANASATAATEPSQEEKNRLSLEKLRAIQEAKMREYVFSPEGKLDPFRPIEALIAPREAQVATEQTTPLTPLQKMELSQLKLVAVVMANDNTRALVEDSTGMGYIVQVGTLMGTRGGQVVGIQPDKIEVKEFVQNYLGEKKSRIKELKLNPIEGEKK